MLDFRHGNAIKKEVLALLEDVRMSYSKDRRSFVFVNSNCMDNKALSIEEGICHFI